MNSAAPSRVTLFVLAFLLWWFLATVLWLPLAAFATGKLADSRRTEKVPATLVIDRRWNHGEMVAEFPAGAGVAQAVVISSRIPLPGNERGRGVGIGTRFTLYVEPGNPANYALFPTDQSAWSIRRAQKLVDASPFAAGIVAAVLLLLARHALTRWADAIAGSRRMGPSIRIRE